MANTGKTGGGVVVRLLLFWLLGRGDGYRPERHYLRGGRTPGAKSLAAA